MSTVFTFPTVFYNAVSCCCALSLRLSDLVVSLLVSVLFHHGLYCVKFTIRLACTVLDTRYSSLYMLQGLTLLPFFVVFRELREAVFIVLILCYARIFGLDTAAVEVITILTSWFSKFRLPTGSAICWFRDMKYCILEL